MQALKGQLQKHDIKIENMEREISDQKLTVVDERSQNQELLDLKLKHQQQEMELSHFKAILLDQDGNKDILPAEIMAQINTDDPKTLKETINVNDKISDNSKAFKVPIAVITKQSDSRNMNDAAHIENTRYEGLTKLNQNPHIECRKAKLNEEWRECKGMLDQNTEHSQMDNHPYIIVRMIYT